MSVLILASVSTFLVILFATTAYIVNNGTFSKIRTDYDSKMQGIVSQMNNTEYKNYEKDRQSHAMLNRNITNINTLQEAELEMKTDVDNFKKLYNTTTTGLRNDLTTTTSNLNYITEVVNNMPVAEQTQDILGLQGTSQNHENRIQGNESKLTSHTSFINNLSDTSLAHRNAILSLSNQSTIYTSNTDYLLNQNEINKSKIHLQGLSNQTLNNNLAYLGKSFTDYTSDSLNWMSYAHSNLYSNVIPTLNTINQNYVAKNNYNAHSNIVSQNLVNINSTLTDLPYNYAKLGDFNNLKERTGKVESLTSTLRSQYDGIATTYATLDDVLKIKLTHSDNDNADRILTSSLSSLSGTVAGMKTVDDTLGRDISKNSAEISTLKSQYTGLDSAYKTIITKDNAGANTFKLNVNDNTNSKTAFQIVNGQSVLLDIKANGTTTLNNLNINATGTTNLSGTTTIDNKIPATQPWVQSVLNNGITTGNINTPNVGRAKNNGDWFRINQDNAGTGVSTALYNGLSINDGGGLDVGTWNKQPTGQIHANYIKSRGDAQVDGTLNAGNLKLNGQQVATVNQIPQQNYNNVTLTGTTEINGNLKLNGQQVATVNQIPQQNYNNVTLTGTTTTGNINTPNVGRAKNNGDWFRINQDNAGTGVSTALYNGLSINDGGGLDVGTWNKQPTGQIHANYIKSRGDAQVDGTLNAGNLKLNGQQVATVNDINKGSSGNTSDTINNIKFSSKWSSYPDGAIDKSEISNDTENFKSLMIGGNKSGKGLRRVSMWDQVAIGSSDWYGVNDTTKLFTQGDIWARNSKVYAAAYPGNSDMAYKKNIKGINTEEIDAVNKLKPVSYNMKVGDDKKKYGFIAQDIENIYPEMVLKNPEGMRSLDYNQFVPLLTGKINKLNPSSDKLCLDDICINKDELKQLKNILSQKNNKI